MTAVVTTGISSRVSNLEVKSILPSVASTGLRTANGAKRSWRSPSELSGKCEGVMKVMPDGPRTSFRPEVQGSFRTSGMETAARTK